ncbi:MAG: 5'-methylthioadenosine/adenosylhomocysteine nucleosidase [Candidatus Izemoplasmatales bacterium]|jgi:adenosylhomocysteine nucleosidase
MIAIIGAMDLELEWLFQRFSLKEEVTFADKKLFLGKIEDQEVVIAKSGIGKVNATIATAYILSHYQVDYLINIGVAGGIAGVEIGDLLLSEGICYFDVSLTGIDAIPYGKMGDDPLIVRPDPSLRERAMKLLEKHRFAYQSGMIASGDSFVTNISQVERIIEVVPNIKACEMEGMAIGMCCHKFNVPFLSIRGISDLIQKDNQKEMYSKSLKDVAKLTAGFALMFLLEEQA